MTLSTHVLDAARGRPATGIGVRWETRDPAGTWQLTARGVTDDDGRVGGDAWQRRDPRAATALGSGRHRLVFDVEGWAVREGLDAFFPEVTVTFVIAPPDVGRRQHVPLLISPSSYTTYRAG